MHLIQGVILDVVDKGDPNKPWAILALQTQSRDRDGIEIVETVKVRVFGDLIKQGVHNAYRQAKGQCVYAPVSAQCDRDGKTVSYMLTGLPERLQVIPVKQAS